MKGKVVLVRFPFDDLSASKVRPAVCVTEPIGPYQHVVVAFITSQIPSELLDSDVVLDASQRDFSATGLRVTSTLRLHRPMTVSADLLLRELGSLPATRQREVARKLHRLFEPHAVRARRRSGKRPSPSAPA